MYLKINFKNKKVVSKDTTFLLLSELYRTFVVTKLHVIRCDKEIFTLFLIALVDKSHSYERKDRTFVGAAIEWRV